MSPVIKTATATRSVGVAGTPKSFARENQKAAKPRKRARIVAGKSVPGAKKIANQLLPTFSRQLSAMLSAGMPIIGCLNALLEQQENPNFKTVILQVKASIENGSSLSESLRPYPSIFDTLYVNMVRGGETGGQLAETIARVATFLESSAKLRRKVKSAMTYPIIVLSIALLIALGMILFIVPVFAGMFADFGADLPGPTQFLINLSDDLRTTGPFVLPVIIAAVVAFKKWNATESGAYMLDKVKLKVPVFGELAIKVASARFARTFAQLIHSGVPILTALEIGAGATGNRVAGQIILEARDAVERGDSLSASLVGNKVFPPIMVRMLSAGEKTGKIDEMMDSIADFYDDEIEVMLASLTALIEPFLMVFLGVVVGGILIGMFLPIFKMGEIVNM